PENPRGSNTDTRRDRRNSRRIHSWHPGTHRNCPRRTANRPRDPPGPRDSLPRNRNSRRGATGSLHSHSLDSSDRPDSTGKLASRNRDRQSFEGVTDLDAAVPNSSGGNASSSTFADSES